MFTRTGPHSSIVGGDLPPGIYGPGDTPLLYHGGLRNDCPHSFDKVVEGWRGSFGDRRGRTGRPGGRTTVSTVENLEGFSTTVAEPESGARSIGTSFTPKVDEGIRVVSVPSPDPDRERNRMER